MRKVLDEGDFVEGGGRNGPAAEPVDGHVGVHAFDEGASGFEPSPAVPLLFHCNFICDYIHLYFTIKGDL